MGLPQGRLRLFARGDIAYEADEARDFVPGNPGHGQFNEELSSVRATTDYLYAPIQYRPLSRAQEMRQTPTMRFAKLRRNDHFRQFPSDDVGAGVTENPLR